MTNRLINTLTAGAIISALTTTSVSAHDSCNVNLDAGFSINQTAIEFLDDQDKSLYKIVNDNTLMVAGNEVALSSSQQALLTDYSTSIRKVVPQVQTIAIEGVDLAIDGVNLAFNELLGQGNDLGAELTQELTIVRQEIDSRLSVEQGFTIGANGIENGDFLGDEFEQRIESVVEKAVMNSMGSLLVAIGQEMLFSGGDTDAFEARMESFGENIEQQMELRAEKIEHKAEKLCLAVVEIDQLEEQLKSSIEELANIDVISTKQNHNDDHQSNDNQLM